MHINQTDIRNTLPRLFFIKKQMCQVIPGNGAYKNSFALHMSYKISIFSQASLQKALYLVTFLIIIKKKHLTFL